MKWAKRRAAADDSAELPPEEAAAPSVAPATAVPVVWLVVSLFFRLVGCIRFIGRVSIGRFRNLPATIGATIRTMNRINRVKYRMA